MFIIKLGLIFSVLLSPEVMVSFMKANKEEMHFSQAFIVVTSTNTFAYKSLKEKIFAGFISSWSSLR